MSIYTVMLPIAIAVFFALIVVLLMAARAETKRVQRWDQERPRRLAQPAPGDRVPAGPITSESKV